MRGAVCRGCHRVAPDARPIDGDLGRRCRSAIDLPPAVGRRIVNRDLVRSDVRIEGFIDHAS